MKRTETMPFPTGISKRVAGGLLLGCVILFLPACAGPPRPLIEDLRGHENLSSYALQQIRGTRDGDRLAADANFGDGSSTLTVKMTFAVGVPTKLKSGQWQWTRDGHVSSGMLAERSVMFLGGQDGPPSLGGRFDLLDPAGNGEYRINLPTTQLKVKLPSPG